LSNIHYICPKKQLTINQLICKHNKCHDWHIGYTILPISCSGTVIIASVAQIGNDNEIEVDGFIMIQRTPPGVNNWLVKNRINVNVPFSMNEHCQRYCWLVIDL